VTSPILSLRAAIRFACAVDPALAAIMDPAIHDEPPAGASILRASFGDVELRDLSSSTEAGHEQDVAILIWSPPAGAAAGLAAAARLAKILDGANLTLEGHRLVSLAVTEVGAKRDESIGAVRVALRLRAVTEVAA
jgi:hypothetical protein